MTRTQCSRHAFLTRFIVRDMLAWLELSVAGMHAWLEFIVPGMHAWLELSVPGIHAWLEFIVPGMHVWLEFIVPGMHAWLVLLHVVAVFLSTAVCVSCLSQFILEVKSVYFYLLQDAVLWKQLCLKSWTVFSFIQLVFALTLLKFPFLSITTLTDTPIWPECALHRVTDTCRYDAWRNYCASGDFWWVWTNQIRCVRFVVHPSTLQHVKDF